MELNIPKMTKSGFLKVLEHYGGKTVLVTGGGGSIGNVCDMGTKVDFVANINTAPPSRTA